MIRPAKHMDLDTSVLNVAAHVIGALLATGTIRYDELLSRLQGGLSDSVRFQFVFALDLLYALGKIDYDSDSDSISLVHVTAEERS